MPSASAGGNLLLATLEMDNEGSNRANITSGPAGWTHLGQVATSNNNVSLDIWYKFRSSGDPTSFTWSVGPDPQDIVGGIIAFSGISSTRPLDAWVSQAVAGSPTNVASVSGFTTTANNEELVFLSAFNADANLTGVTAGFGQQWNLITGWYASGAGFTKLQATAGATRTVQGDVYPGVDWAVALVGLRPGS